jgi:osmotically-inducible protein OsmY/sporulation protein YlmC with PRC-barrel domain
MKNQIGISVIIITALCGAAQRTVADDSVQKDSCRLGRMDKASTIIGLEIKDAQDQRLGKVKDLAVDLQNGRVVEVIVAKGGVLGLEEQLVAVPPGQFTADPAEKGLQLNADTARFKEAPTFKMSEWDPEVQQGRIEEVYQCYGTQPYFAANGQSGDLNNNSTPAHASEAAKAAQNAPPYLGHVQRASKLIGTPVRNLQDEKIGNAENLVVDLPAGRVVEVIVASGGFLGMGDELSAIPPQSFRSGPEPETLVLDTTKEALSSAPHFKSSDWRDVNNPEYVGKVYQSYNVNPYFDTNAVDNTAQNVRDRNDASMTPLNQGTSQADLDITRQIRKAIMDADGLSVDARNVKIITLDGRVTLRGPVKSEEEKQRIADIAARVASPANVDNQLQVENETKTSSIQ